MGHGYGRICVLVIILTGFGPPVRAGAVVVAAANQSADIGAGISPGTEIGLSAQLTLAGPGIAGLVLGQDVEVVTIDSAQPILGSPAQYAGSDIRGDFAVGELGQTDVVSLRLRRLQDVLGAASGALLDIGEPIGLALVVPLGPMPLGLLVQFWVEPEEVMPSPTFAAGGFLGQAAAFKPDYQSEGRPLTAVIPEPDSAVVLLLGIGWGLARGQKGRKGRKGRKGQTE